jgi:hypothetical protein
MTRLSANAAGRIALLKRLDGIAVSCAAERNKGALGKRWHWSLRAITAAPRRLRSADSSIMKLSSRSGRSGSQCTHIVQSGRLPTVITIPLGAAPNQAGLGSGGGRALAAKRDLARRWYPGSRAVAAGPRAAIWVRTKLRWPVSARAAGGPRWVPARLTVWGPRVLIRSR